MAKKTVATPPPATLSDARVVVLHGNERFIQDLETQRLKASLIERYGEIDTLRFDGLSGGGLMADVLDECRSFGLMQQHKLVIVDNADQLLKGDDEPAAPKAKGSVHRSGRQIMDSYCASPSDQATLLLRCDRWYPGNLDKSISKVGYLKKCERPDMEFAVTWAVNRCKKRHEATIDPAAAALLVEHLGADLGRIDSELSKLALVHPGKPIGVEEVRAMVGVTREEELWSIQSQLITGDAADGLRRLRDLIEISREDPVPITYAYIDLARKLHGVARARPNENPMALKTRYKLWGPSAETVMKAGRKLSGPVAAKLLEAAVQTDQRLKSSAGDAVCALEVLTLRFATAFAAPRR
ncbi:MAG: DNA polymerase III subunit delta [Pyrinomonadaceae bacterium]|nr:DNA polymerase III subunit delta [Phycisphaerales bacterium]